MRLHKGCLEVAKKKEAIIHLYPKYFLSGEEN